VAFGEAFTKLKRYSSQVQTRDSAKSSLPLILNVDSDQEHGE
jgi:hypothetical protein